MRKGNPNLKVLLAVGISCMCVTGISLANGKSSASERIEMVAYNAAEKSTEVIVHPFSEENLPGTVFELDDGGYVKIQPAHMDVSENAQGTNLFDQDSKSEAINEEIHAINYEEIEFYVPEKTILLSSPNIKGVIVNHKLGQSVFLSPEVELEKKIDGKWVRIPRDEDLVSTPTRSALGQILEAKSDNDEAEGAVWLSFRHFSKQQLLPGLYRIAVEIGERIYYAEFRMVEE